MKRIVTLLLSCIALCSINAEVAQIQERLNRGAVAIKLSSTRVYISWRFLSTDTENTSFNIYRDGQKINSEPITRSTCYIDENGSPTAVYTITTEVDGSTTQSVDIPEVWDNFYKKINLSRPPAGKTPSGGYYSYTPNDCSVGDVDGDGQYELFVKWDPTNSQDNSKTGYTGHVYIDCYKLDDTLLWRVDLGCNIRAGAHYTQFMVYDLDGDGKAEMACKTAPGTIDGKGNPVLMGSDKVTDDYRNSDGIIIKGSEYLTVFSGKTGENIATTAYTPARGKQSEWGKDSYGNRSERYLACVAYLDGKKASLVMCRGYYQRTALAAYDFDGTNLTLRWLYDSKMVSSGTAYGQGNHNLSVGDVDNDGKDEIIYGACAFDDDGSLMYRTGIGHGDAIHLSDLDPDREGLEVFTPHEETSAAYGYEMHDARTGEIIHGVKTGTDVGRGLAADVNKNYRGQEMWAKNEVYDCKGNLLSLSRPSVNFRIYWNGDLYDDLLDGTKITTFSGATATQQSNLKDLSTIDKSASCNSTKATPNLQADILGDWREEVILWSQTDSASVNIFTSTITTEYRIPTLMHDHVYRMGIVWQNTAYNQPPHLGYYLPDVYSRDAILRFEPQSGSATQKIDIGYAITPIILSWEKATSASVTKLPDGLTATIDEVTQTITISGTPTATTTLNFTINTIGGETTAKQPCTIYILKPDVLNELAYYPFNETSGSIANNVIEGVATASGSLSPIWVEGKTGNALSFSGTTTDRYMKQESYSKLELGTSNFTIELWARGEASSTDHWYLLHKGSHAANASTGASGKWFGLELKNGTLTFAIDDNQTKSTVATSALDYFKGKWTHIVATRDNGSLKLYLNGQLVATGVDNTGNISEQELLVIGNSNVNFDTPYTGDIDELHIYSGAMSESKVLAIYNGDNTPISNIKDNDSFRVTPSAFESNISITTPKCINGNVCLKIININGQEALSRSYHINGGATLHIDGLNALPHGMYIITLTNESNTYSAKVLKRR